MNELGLYPGAQIEIVAAGSWGRPVMLRVGMSKFAVCQKLAKQIFIQFPAHPQSA
jgi:Fe2+ transport system protein FeoA